MRTVRRWYLTSLSGCHAQWGMGVLAEWQEATIIPTICASSPPPPYTAHTQNSHMFTRAEGNMQKSSPQGSQVTGDLFVTSQARTNNFTNNYQTFIFFHIFTVYTSRIFKRLMYNNYKGWLWKRFIVGKVVKKTLASPGVRTRESLKTTLANMPWRNPIKVYVNIK